MVANIRITISGDKELAAKFKAMFPAQPTSKGSIISEARYSAAQNYGTSRGVVGNFFFTDGVEPMQKELIANAQAWLQAIVKGQGAAAAQPLGEAVIKPTLLEAQKRVKARARVRTGFMRDHVNIIIG